MAITYPLGDTTPQLKLARMLRRKRRVIQLGNALGLWREFNVNRWYIVNINIPTEIGSGWKGLNTYHLDKVRIDSVASYSTQAEANAVYETISNQTNIVVGQFGLTSDQYDSLANNAKARYAYSNRLSAADWNDAKKWLQTRRRRITDEINIQQALVENDATGDDDAADV